MTDILRPYVPEYKGDLEKDGESILLSMKPVQIVYAIDMFMLIFWHWKLVWWQALLTEEVCQPFLAATVNENSFKLLTIVESHPT